MKGRGGSPLSGSSQTTALGKISLTDPMMSVVGMLRQFKHHHVFVVPVPGKKVESCP